jgi:hypothetical protein
MWVQVETVIWNQFGEALEGLPGNSHRLSPPIAGRCPAWSNPHCAVPFRCDFHTDPEKRGGRGLRPSLDPRSLADQRLATRDGQSALARALDRSCFTYFVL